MNTANNYVIIFGDSQIFVSDVYMEDTANTKCQLHLLHLEEYFIQQKHDKNFRLLC